MNAVNDRPGAAAVIELDKLQRRLGIQTVLNGISARVFPGEVVGLIGQNGAGKTTLLDTLLGFGSPDFGHCDLWGERATHLSDESKHRIGYVPQRDELPGEMTAEQLFHLYRQLRPRWDQPLVDRLLEEWGIETRRRIKRLSVGQKQKLAIVLALAHQPDLLVLDEPVASLDPLARRQFLQQLMDYAADGERTILFSSHIVSDMERIADRIWCLAGTTLRCDRALDDLYETVQRVSYRGAIDAATLEDESWVVQHWPHAEGGELVADPWTPESRQRLTELGATLVDCTGLPLEEIFLHWLGGHRG